MSGEVPTASEWLTGCRRGPARMLACASVVRCAGLVGLAFAALACHGLDTVRATPIGDGGAAGLGGAGGAGGSTSGNATIPVGSWAAVGWDTPCPIEVSAGPNVDVPSLTWTPCPEVVGCWYWSGDGFDDFSFGAADVNVAVTEERTYVSALFSLTDYAPMSVVWDLASGDPVLAWRSRQVHCTPYAIATEEFMWLTVQHLGDVYQQQYLEHDYVGGSYRLLDIHFVQPQIQGNERFLVLGQTNIWDRKAEAFVDHMEGIRPALQETQIFFMSDLPPEPAAYGGSRWDPDSGIEQAVPLAAGETLIDICATKSNLVWLHGDYAYPDLADQVTLHWAPLPPPAGWPVAGVELATLPASTWGRTSSRYYAGKVSLDDLLVVDLTSGAVVKNITAPQGFVQKVVFVGDDGVHSGESLWFKAVDGLYRYSLP